MALNLIKKFRTMIDWTKEFFGFIKEAAFSLFPLYFTILFPPVAVILAFLFITAVIASIIDNAINEAISTEDTTLSRGEKFKNLLKSTMKTLDGFSEKSFYLLIHIMKHCCALSLVCTTCFLALFPGVINPILINPLYSFIASYFSIGLIQPYCTVVLCMMPIALAYALYQAYNDKSQPLSSNVLRNIGSSTVDMVLLISFFFGFSYLLNFVMIGAVEIAILSTLFAMISTHLVSSRISFGINVILSLAYDIVERVCKHVTQNFNKEGIIKLLLCECGLFVIYKAAQFVVPSLLYSQFVFGVPVLYIFVRLFYAGSYSLIKTDTNTGLIAVHVSTISMFLLTIGLKFLLPTTIVGLSALVTAGTVVSVVGLGGLFIKRYIDDKKNTTITADIETTQHIVLSTPKHLLYTFNSNRALHTSCLPVAIVDTAKEAVLGAVVDGMEKVNKGRVNLDNTPPTPIASL